MAFSRLLRAREESGEALAEEKAHIEDQMLELHKKLEVYYSPAWEQLEDMLREEQQSAFTDMMSGEGDQILFARERAKLVARFLRRKADMETDLERLRAERSALEE